MRKFITNNRSGYVVVGEERRFAHNERHPDGSGIPDMPEMKWLSNGDPDFSHLTNTTKEENAFEKVRRHLRVMFGQAQGEEMFQSMTFQELQKALENLNGEKQIFANKGKDRQSVPDMPEARWLPNGKPDFSHLNT